jgi:hypothetical protein
VGAAAGIEGARDAALNGEGYWDRALGRRTYLGITAAVLVLTSAVAFVVQAFEEGIGKGFIAGLLALVAAATPSLMVAAVLQLLLFGLVRLARATGAATGVGLRPVLWCFASSTGPPLFALVLALRVDDGSGLLSFSTMIAAQAVAMVTLAALLALGGGSVASPILLVPQASEPASRWARAVAAGSLGLALVLGALVIIRAGR